MLGLFDDNHCHHIALFYAVQFYGSGCTKRHFYLLARFYARECGRI
jgi:hypothetical protein